ncbi:MAG: transporter [Flavobacteriales bacterium CG_4_9_14_3_um_filter_32_8]|nr:MAG: transporter [Flavobacteriales bacterium CG_4_9_14_3_um_filter_32_8]
MIFRIKLPLFCLFLGSILPIFLVAQTTENSFSLKQAQDYALKNNYQIKNAQLDVTIAKKKVWETTAYGLPQVMAEAKFQNFIDLPTNLIPANAFNPLAPEGEFAELQFGTDYNTSATISASQLIFDGSYIVGLQAARTYQELSVNSKKKTDEEIKDAVAQAYHTVLVAKENEKVLAQSFQSMETLLTETKAIFKEGLTEEQNVDQLQLNLTNIENAANQAKRQVEIANNLLKFQLGIELNQTITLTDELSQLIAVENETTLMAQQFDFSNHFNYQLIQTSEKLTKLNYRKEKYAFAPSLAAFFSHQQQNMNNEFDAFNGGKWYPTTLWGLSLKLPIFTSGMRLSKMSQAKLEYEKAINNSKQVEQSLILQAQTAQSAFNTAYDTYANQKKSLELAKSIHNKTIKKYGEGVVTSMELTQSQTQLLSTEGLYIKSILELLNAKSALKKALGKE